MVDVWVSRHSPGLVPGQGDLIDWEINEKCRLYSMKRHELTDRIVTVKSKRRASLDAPAGEYVREVLDTDGEIACYIEKSLWFVDQPEIAKINDDGTWG